MRFTDIARKNVIRNLRSYGLYIGTTIFSITVYVSFMMLRYTNEFASITASSDQISGMMTAGSFVLMIFAGLFITYSNTFFMRKRMNEIGLYALIGMRKRTIALMMFTENVLLGFFSLLIGLILGILSSRLFALVLMRLMNLEVVTHIGISPEAVIQTVAVFGLIFLFTSTVASRMIYRYSLIELFKGSQTSESLPKARLTSALLGIIFISSGYMIALQDLTDSAAWQFFKLSTPLVIISLTVIGTGLLITSSLFYLLTYLRTRIRWSWKKLNVFTASQLLYRIRGNAKSLTLIAVLSAVTMTAGGAVYGLYYTVDEMTTSQHPHTFMWQGESPALNSADFIYQEEFDAKQARIHHSDTILEYTIITPADFNNVANHLNKEPIRAISDSEVIIYDGLFDERWSDRPSTVELNNHLYDVSSFNEQALFNTGTVFGPVLILADSVYEQLNQKETTYHYAGTDHYRQQQSLSGELESQLSEDQQFSSAPATYSALITTFGAMLFTGSFLGLVFLIATGSVIFFKLITEAENDKRAYQLLYQVGASYSDIRKSVYQQVGIMFFIPFLIGTAHTAVALTAFSRLLNMDLLIPVTIWILICALINLLYFIITGRYCMKLIMPRVEKGDS
ncbi:ABC transporter permease [Salisediminibacterium selenitireducens]|uniref:ABC3 transporter permease C-terminal domain-containing protein n=1 Tax=Bacillus selenitireducens (strain ATCC 700615 / DSM 15326 / MLS10) TaxID=439292 RepID=D6XXV9_BACIE|nr:ABC transporter permease [Salisediminibacterium selenitireducens]ADI00152.1 protein of unknown function DUF214 [[Bacillus] selenitireducens MLS10]